MNVTKEKSNWSGIIGPLVLAYLVYILWEGLVAIPNEMRAFCEGLVPGTPFDSIKVAAEQRGYHTHEISVDKVLVSAPRTMGRFNCHLDFKDGKLKK
jgi:hypothetical protein